MSLLHVLLAVALPLGLVSAGRKGTSVESGICGMLIIDMAISLLFSGPTEFKVLAATLRALPRTAMSFLVFSIVNVNIRNPAST